MYFIGVLFLGMYLGYKLKALVEMLNYLKIKNYCKILVDRYEDPGYQVIKKVKKVKKPIVEEVIEE